MPKTFGDAEHRILGYFERGLIFSFNNNQYTVTDSGKPTCSHGEPKTDIYISAENDARETREFKISYKQGNANFLENKINAERAEQILGSGWEHIIADAISTLKDEFFEKKLIYKDGFKKSEKGAITLGWKFELLNEKSGSLSGSMCLTKDQIIDVYAGSNLSEDKKNASVNGKKIQNSGVANYILIETEPLITAQAAIDSLVTIRDYVDQNPEIFFACKALNYRSFFDKYDGDRPLAVYVDWSISDEKLDCQLCFDTPLEYGGDYAYAKLKRSMSYLHAITTDELNASNVKDQSKIYSTH